MTYWRLHYHLIWGTQDREPTITPEHEKMFYGVLYNKGKELAACRRDTVGEKPRRQTHQKRYHLKK